MSRDRHPPTPERQKLQDEALEQMRAARKAIGPELLERAREMILQGAALPVDETIAATGDEVVDKAKTLTVLKEFLLLKRDNKKLCGEIRTMLTDRR